MKLKLLRLVDQASKGRSEEEAKLFLVRAHQYATKEVRAMSSDRVI